MFLTFDYWTIVTLGINIPTMRAPASKLESRPGDVTALASITVSSRIAKFWADQSRLWFVQFEVVVATQKLSDAAKQNLSVTKSTIQQISDSLLTPPEERRYETIKDTLVQVFEWSDSVKAAFIDPMTLAWNYARRMSSLAFVKVVPKLLV